MNASELKCCNCGKFPTVCFENTCCNSIFCRSCVSSFSAEGAKGISCPVCHKVASFRPNVPLQRIIDSQKKGISKQIRQDNPLERIKATSKYIQFDKFIPLEDFTVEFARTAANQDPPKKVDTKKSSITTLDVIHTSPTFKNATNTDIRKLKNELHAQKREIDQLRTELEEFKKKQEPVWMDALFNFFRQVLDYIGKKANQLRGFDRINLLFLWFLGLYVFQWVIFYTTWRNNGVSSPTTFISLFIYMILMFYFWCFQQLPDISFVSKCCATFYFVLVWVVLTLILV